MQALDPNLFHFRCNRMLAISRKALHTGPKEEVSADRLGGIEEFIDIAFSISDMDTARWLLEQCR